MMNSSRVRRPELVCPAGNPAMLKAAVEHGADAVYLGFKDATNARNFNGLNFDERSLAQAIELRMRTAAASSSPSTPIPKPKAGPRQPDQIVRTTI